MEVGAARATRIAAAVHAGAGTSVSRLGLPIPALATLHGGSTLQQRACLCRLLQSLEPPHETFSLPPLWPPFLLQERNAAGLEAELASFLDPPASLADLQLGCLALQAWALSNLVRLPPGGGGLA